MPDFVNSVSIPRDPLIITEPIYDGRSNILTPKPKGRPRIPYTAVLRTWDRVSLVPDVIGQCPPQYQKRKCRYVGLTARQNFDEL